MGRTEKSQGLAPPAVRKDMRAKQARAIVKRTVPALLASNARARRGVEASELVVEPGTVGDVEKAREVKGKEKEKGEKEGYVKRKGQGKRRAKGGDVNGEELDVDVNTGKKKGKRDSFDREMTQPSTSIPSPPRRTRIITTDTLTAAFILSPRKLSSKSSKPPQNICILNMASPLRPGGGILAGATSQEEFLCARTTLLPALHDAFYRLPELGGIWTPDVLVFRRAGSLDSTANELAAAERYWVDVVSAGMLRFPDLEGDVDEVKVLSVKDRGMVEAKMRAVLRIAAAKGVRKLVLGAWGCGAYGNPVADIARAWRRVLDGEASNTGGKSHNKAAGETWPLLTDVVFAINSPKMADEFARAFGGGIEVEAGPGGAVDEDEEEGDSEAQELKGKIDDLQDQIGKVWNPELKVRLGIVLEGLQAQLREREGGVQVGDRDQSDSNEGSGDEDDDEDDDEDEDENGPNKITLSSPSTTSSRS